MKKSRIDSTAMSKFEREELEFGSVDSLGSHGIFQCPYMFYLEICFFNYALQTVTSNP